MIRHLYNLRSGHPAESSTHLRPYVGITQLLAVFPMLYFTSPWPFCNYQFLFLSPCAFFTSPPGTPLIWQPSKCSLYLRVCFHSACLFCFLDSIYTWSPMAFFFLWFTSLSTIPSRCIRVFSGGKISVPVLAESCSIVCAHRCFCIHPSADGHQRCFRVWAAVNNPAVNV